MSDLLRLQPLTYPYSAAQLRADEPRLSLSAELPDRELASLATLDPPVSVVRVQPSPRPPDTRTKRWDEAQPVEQGGQWVQQWVERDATPEELAAWDAANAPPPDWIGFVNALGAVQAVEEILSAVLQANKVLHGQFIGGMVQAADGSYAGFLNAWQKGISAGLIQPALAAQIQQVAASYSLPAAFVSGLQTPGLPPIQPGGVQNLGGLGSTVLVTNPLPPMG